MRTWFRILGIYGVITVLINVLFFK